MIFEHKICDGCKKPFEKDDDVVVCPECGTPQHRTCFEENGGCVNASKHAAGFDWKKEEALNNPEPKIAEEEKLNKNADADFNAPQGKKGIFGTMDPGVGDDFDMDSEVPDLDELVESRVRALAPGITDEQRTEELCGEEIGKTISFIGSNALGYVKKFRKTEYAHKRTFNWAAFLFTPIWFFYRKLYKAGAVYISLFISITLLMQKPAEEFLAVYQGLKESGLETVTEADFSALNTVMIPVLIFGAVQLVLRIVAGFTADKMYWKHCRNSLETVRLLQAEKDDFSALSYYLSRCSTSFLAALVAMLAYSFLPQLLLSLF